MCPNNNRLVNKFFSFWDKTPAFAFIATFGWFLLNPSVSQSQYMQHSVFLNTGNSASVTIGAKTLIIQQCIGQEGCIGTFYNNGYILRQGFIQPSTSLLSESINSKELVNIYPNPVKDEINLGIASELSGEITINLYDICGKKLFTGKYISVTEIKLDFIPPTAGMYLIEVRSGQKNYTIKLIKE